MKALAISVVLVASVLGSVGQLLFKTVARRRLAMLIEPAFYWAACLYGVATLLFLLALRIEQLTLLYPLVSTSYIWTSLLAMRYLGEPMGPSNWAGVVSILVGVYMVVS